MKSVIEIVLFTVVFGMVVVAMASVGRADTQANVAKIILDMNQNHAKVLAVSAR